MTTLAFPHLKPGDIVETVCATCGEPLRREVRQLRKTSRSFCNNRCAGNYYRGKGESPQERFARSYTVRADGCWEWHGDINQYGYGRLWDGGRLVSAHRFSYELKHGSIPDGLHLDHLCRFRACVNPDHLEPVTVRENTLRGEAPSTISHHTQTCKRGHSYAEHSYYRDGVRVCCRTCESENQRRRTRRGVSPDAN